MDSWFPLVPALADSSPDLRIGWTSCLVCLKKAGVGQAILFPSGELGVDDVLLALSLDELALCPS